MRLVDYVVVHELVHLRHRGHGRDYWQAVGRVMPDYERRRADLTRVRPHAVLVTPHDNRLDSKSLGNSISSVRELCGPPACGRRGFVFVRVMSSLSHAPQ